MIIIFLIMIFKVASLKSYSIKNTRLVHNYRFDNLMMASNPPIWSSIDSFSILSRSILIIGKVAKGYGRGSKKLGVPTANIPYFDKELTENSFQNGVYFGWGKIASDTNIYPVIANIGKSPTFAGQVLL